MRILITGGAGFIGSHLTDRLIAEGHDITCVDNFITGKRENIAGFMKHPKYRLIEHDISKPLEITMPVDFILHFASPASPRDYLRFPIQTLKVGSVGTLNALGIAKARGAKFMLASTSEVYGDPLVHPQPETYWGNVNPIGPRGVYDEAKRFAESLTMAYRQEHKINTRIIRIFNTYGPRMRMEDGRAVPTFIGQALRGEPLTVYGQGQQTRSFCYVDDLVEGIRRFMDVDDAGPINIGNPDERTLLDLAKMVQEHFPSSSIEHAPLPADDPKQRRPDLTRARTLLKWDPKVPLDVGLRKTIEWFRQQAGRGTEPTPSAARS